MSNAYHKDRNCFKLCVIAHGDGENIYTKGKLMAVTLYEDEYEEYGWQNHDLAWNIEEIRNNLDEVTSLLGKPKVLVIDACRGGKLELNFIPFPVADPGGGQGRRAAPSPGV